MAKAGGVGTSSRLSIGSKFVFTVASCVSLSLAAAHIFPSPSSPFQTTDIIQRTSLSSTLFCKDFPPSLSLFSPSFCERESVYFWVATYRVQHLLVVADGKVPFPRSVVSHLSFFFQLRLYFDPRGCNCSVVVREAPGLCAVATGTGGEGRYQ